MQYSVAKQFRIKGIIKINQLIGRVVHCSYKFKHTVIRYK
jgi:hypothetical protein